MKNIQLMLIPLLVVIFSFKPDVITDQKPSIVGVWVKKEGNYYNRTYKRVNKFSRSKGGMQFLEDGTFTYRVNAGWCGTPPITYSNQKGIWETLADGNIKITYDTRSGAKSQIFTINKIKKNQLQVSIVR